MKESTPEARLLGQKVSHPENYTPDILVAVPRAINRKDLNIEESSLPFYGFDTWHAYEFSFLTSKGLPVNGLLKLVYSSGSLNIVESKSLKLYLNSFNMSRFGSNKAKGIEEVKRKIKRDLKNLIKD